MDNDPKYKFPIIDLSMVHDPVKRKETVDQIRNAAKSWGFFLIVNHGVPENIQKEMTTGIREFFELDVEQKKEFYDRDATKKYTAEMIKLGELLFQLLSEALGLEPNYLKDIDCMEGLGLGCHYHPPCPQPELAIGAVHHADVCLLTIILQDQIGGLQVLHRGSWIDVPFVPGAMVVNIGDMLQVIIHYLDMNLLNREL
ncbi:1-aminocyclopropane-1-carboxylate oxidase homolog 6 [Linum perenne]